MGPWALGPLYIYIYIPYIFSRYPWLLSPMGGSMHACLLAEAMETTDSNKEPVPSTKEPAHASKPSVLKPPAKEPAQTLVLS